MDETLAPADALSEYVGILSALLDDHDGDDRCHCLRELLIDAVAGEVDAPEAVRRVASCMAEHPAGATLRGQAGI